MDLVMAAFAWEDVVDFERDQGLAFGFGLIAAVNLAFPRGFIVVLEGSVSMLERAERVVDRLLDAVSARAGCEAVRLSNVGAR